MLSAAAIVACLVAALSSSVSLLEGKVAASRARRVASAAPASTTLPAAARGAVARALGEGDRQFFVRSSVGGFVLGGRRAGVSARFTRGRVVVHAGGASWPLALGAVGRGHDVARVVAAAPIARANRVRYVRSGVEEWYADGPLGLEQGFTLTSRPSGVGGVPLTLALGDLPSGVWAGVSSDGRNAWLVRGGRVALRYSGLFASDAGGHPLPAWITVVGRRISLRVDDRGARYPVRVDPFVQAGKLDASDGAAQDSLGFSAAVSGDTIVVGAPHATVGGNTDRGAAYVFVESGGGWTTATETAKLTAAGGAANDEFGSAVAIDGDTIVVGAPTFQGAGAGAAYVFVRPAGGWGSSAATQAKLTGSDGAGSNFGSSVGISGGTIAVGGSMATVAGNFAEGAAYVFVEPGGGWTNTAETARLTAADGAASEAVGASVAVSGDTVAVGAPHATVSNLASGAAYVFAKPAAGWGGGPPAEAKLTASDPSGGDLFGTSIAVFGDTVAVGAPQWANMGSAYVFVEPNTGWTTSTETAELTPSQFGNNGNFGWSVAVSADTIAVGAPQISSSANGAVFIFARPAGGWGSATPTQNELAVPDLGGEFGYSVAIESGTIVAGAPTATVSGHSAQGAAYVFVDTGSTSTSVGCVPSSVTVGQATTCSMTVSNSAPGAADPTGSVTFSTNSSGSVDSGGACRLAGTGAGAATCSVGYTPGAVGSGTHRITAAYEGDGSHEASSATTTVTVTGNGSGGGGSGGGGTGGGGSGGGGGSSVIARVGLLGNSGVMPGGIALTAGGSSAGSGGTITDYTWSVGSGGSSNSFNCGGSPNLSFAVNVPGSYQVAVTATNSLGASSTASTVVSVPASLVTHPAGAVAAAVGGAGAWAASCATGVVPGSPGCVTSFQFGIIDAVSESGACFSISQRLLSPTSGAHDAVSAPATIPTSDYFQYTATINGPVSLNGLYLPLAAGHLSTLRTAGSSDAGAIDFGTVSVGADGYSLLRVGLTQTLNAYTYSDSQQIGDFGVGTGRSGFEGLPFSGGMSLTLGYQKAVVGAQVTLPSILSVVGGPATLSGTLTVSNEVPAAYALHANFSQLDLGFMTISDASAGYDQALGELKIGGKIEIAGAGVDMTPIPPNGIIFQHGQFKAGGLNFVFPSCCEPEIFPGITISSIGGSIQVNPVVLEGRIGLHVLDLAQLNGTMLVGFPSPSAPFTLTSAWLPAIAGTSLNDQVFSSAPLIGVGATVTVDVPVLKTLDLGSGYLVYDYPGYVALGGRVNLDVLDGLLNWGGGMSGAFNAQTGAFDVEGYVYGSIADVLSGSFRAVVSDQGAGGCADIAGVQVGGGMQWAADHPYIYPGGCIFERFTEDHVFGAADAAQAPRSFRIHLRRGAPTQVIRLDAQAGAPAVRVSGPDGLTLTSPAAAGLVHTGTHLAIIRSLRMNMTEIGLHNPRPGVYTITPLPGSPPISSVATALAPPPASMKARVLGTGARRSLVYDVRRRFEQTVTVFEVNSEGISRQIGTIHGGGHGKLRFTATPDRGVQRIVAKFTLHGIPVPDETITVARLRPPPITLPAPRRLRLTRTRAGLAVRWSAVPGAARYALAVRQPTRGVLELFTAPGRRTVTIPGLDPATGGTVTVITLSSSYSRGAKTQAGFKPLPRKPTKRKPGPGHTPKPTHK
jgi:hypothetical protein